MRDKGVTAEELVLAKESITRPLPANFETTSSTASTMASLYLFDLPLDYYETLPARIDGITTEDVAAVAKRFLTPERMVVVAVGDRKTIQPQLEKLNPASSRTPTPPSNRSARTGLALASAPLKGPSMMVKLMFWYWRNWAGSTSSGAYSMTMPARNAPSRLRSCSVARPRHNSRPVSEIRRIEIGAATIARLKRRRSKCSTSNGGATSVLSKSTAWGDNGLAFLRRFLVPMRESPAARLYRIMRGAGFTTGNREFRAAKFTPLRSTAVPGDYTVGLHGHGR
jgi:hypothetical protein